MVIQKEIIFKVPEFPHISETFIVAQLVTALELGYTIRILTRKILDSDYSMDSPLIHQYGLMDKVMIENYKIPKNKIVRLVKWCALLLWHFKQSRYIIRYYKEQSAFSLTTLFQWHFYSQFNNASIMHVQYGTNSKPLGLIKKTGYFNPAVVVTFHGHDAFFPINGFIENNGYYDDIFKYADMITVNTPYLKEQIINLGCSIDKISIIPVGVDTRFFQSKATTVKTDHQALSLITIGRLDKVKGHHYCIEVVKGLLDRGVDVNLTIVGEGLERKFLENEIRLNQLENKIFLVGKKSPSEIVLELYKHDIYLLLAVPVDNGRRETQGLATLEAQACGLPAIVFDSGGVKYTVQDGHTGYVCREFDIEQVINKIELLTTASSLRNIMGKEAVKFVENEYSQKVIDAKWEILYNKL